MFASISGNCKMRSCLQLHARDVKDKYTVHANNMSSQVLSNCFNISIDVAYRSQTSKNYSVTIPNCQPSIFPYVFHPSTPTFLRIFFSGLYMVANRFLEISISISDLRRSPFCDHFPNVMFQMIQVLACFLSLRSCSSSSMSFFFLISVAFRCPALQKRRVWTQIQFVHAKAQTLQASGKLQWLEENDPVFKENGHFEDVFCCCN